MTLTRLIYASTAAAELTQDAVTEILSTSRHNNQRDHITGMLCFSDTLFLQCLEGARGVVNATYDRILRDPRHSRAEILDYRAISEREFSQWRMGYVAPGAANRRLLLRYGTDDRFDPYRMSAESAHALLIVLSTQAPIE